VLLPIKHCADAGTYAGGKASLAKTGLIEILMKTSFMENKQVLKFLCATLLMTSGGKALAFKFVEKDPDGTTHIRAPFVHVDVSPQDEAGSHVKVKAPFTHVYNRPQYYGSPSVKAPFTKVQADEVTGAPRVDAPFTKVRHDQVTGAPKVDAPFTKVRENSITGATTVRAPFTRVNNPPGPANATVKAPLTKVNDQAPHAQKP